MPLRLEIALGRQLPEMPEGRISVVAPQAASWPFLYPLALALPERPSAIVVPDLHEAFVNQQTASTRLVTTQATYLILTWMDLVGERDIVMIATADRDSLGAHAPEILERRGIFANTTIIAATTTGEGATGAGGATGATAIAALIAAMRVTDARERLALCVRALDQRRDAATLLAAASVCMEVNDLEAAARDLDAALALAPEWAAAHFERGKLSLRLDDMRRASESFGAAAKRMPRFASAWSNLGATLGELDHTSEALEAFTRALGCDPSSASTLNNIGVVQRELGQLAESEAAFLRVVELQPNLAFGYYNLGHTLFLQGRYQAALAAYVNGQKRDPERNPVQACRLAMCRLATGDARGALEELVRATKSLSREYRHQLLADTQTIAWALLTHQPDLPDWSLVNDWLTGELK